MYLFNIQIFIIYTNIVLLITFNIQIQNDILQLIYIINYTIIITVITFINTYYIFQTVRCGNNEVCVLEKVVCIKAPCYPKPVCKCLYSLSQHILLVYYILNINNQLLL